MKYIAVYSWGGIISEVHTGHDLKGMSQKMDAYCHHQRFDPEKDDARIFNKRGKEIYSYQPEEEEA